MIQVSYPTDDMTDEEKLMSLRGNNPHFAELACRLGKGRKTRTINSIIICYKNVHTS